MAADDAVEDAEVSKVGRLEVRRDDFVEDVPRAPGFVPGACDANHLRRVPCFDRAGQCAVSASHIEHAADGGGNALEDGRVDGAVNHQRVAALSAITPRSRPNRRKLAYVLTASGAGRLRLTLCTN